MNSDRYAVDIFLRNAGMHPETLYVAETAAGIMEEMSRGLSGEASSLQMIPTYIDAGKVIPPNKPAVVLDAGGTNLRTALVSFTEEGKTVVEDFRKQPMPGTGDMAVGREEFFAFLASLIKPLIKRSDRIGFCFSYPPEILPDKDGRLIHWSKEIRAPEVVGRLIGADLKEALRECGVKNPPGIVILNDSVAALLTGRAVNAGRLWGGSAGFILGTGTNTCYVESNAAILKVEGLNPDGSQVINCESGGFAGLVRGEGDVMLGETTSNPDAFWLEKMISGAYFGALVGQCVLLGCRKGLFSAEARKVLDTVGTFSTKDADNYCHNPYAVKDNAIAAAFAATAHSDRLRLRLLIDALLERAARLTAANLAAAILKSPAENGPLEPACLTIDGTAYYRYYRFQHRVEGCLRSFLAERDKYYETVQVDDAPLAGAAAAALTNL